MKTFLPTVGCWLCAAVYPVAAVGADEPASSAHAAASSTEPSKHVVAKGPLQVDLTLDGVFDSREKEEVVLRPELWAELVVREAVPQGAVVKAGDVLIKLIPTKLEEAIKDLETTLKISDLTLRQQESDLAQIEKTSPLDLQSALRTKRTADEDLKHFSETDREMKTRMADFMLKNSEQRLEYVLEELKQLQKMYRADDLREETEEIILKRQRNEVEAARFNLDQTKATHEQTIKTSLPREDERLRDATERSTLALEKLQLSSPNAITKARMELEKQRMDQAKNSEKLEKLRRDLAMMTVRAPRSGVVYYGANKLGQWTTAANIAPRMERGGSVQAHEVLMTIVNPKTLEVRAVAPETALHLLRAGLAGHVTPTGYPDERIPATIEDLPTYPDVSGKFATRLTLDAGRLDKLEHSLVPGLTCKVKLISFHKADALTIPAKALFTDDAADASNYVFVEEGDGKAKRRDVQVGHRTAERVEITGGLHEGETVLLQRPKEM